MVKMNQKTSLMILLAVALLGCTSTSLTQSNTDKITKTSTQQKIALSSSSSAQILPVTAKTTINQEIIELEVAQTQKQQALGLMFREALPKNRGMLFPFDEPQITQFWMKNVAISLDMIFLYKGEVKAIAENVPPCVVDPCPIYGPNTLIDQVLELGGGRAKELNLQVGDRLKIEFLDITQ